MLCTNFASRKYHPLLPLLSSRSSLDLRQLLLIVSISCGMHQELSSTFLYQVFVTHSEPTQCDWKLENTDEHENIGAHITGSFMSILVLM